MATYLELKEQAEKLLAQAEEMRERETAQAIEDIKAKMKAYGLTPQDLGFGGGGGAGGAARRGPGRRSTKGSTAPVKYRGPHGEAWSGRGRQPKWVVEVLASGKSLQDYAVG